MKKVAYKIYRNGLFHDFAFAEVSNFGELMEAKYKIEEDLNERAKRGFSNRKDCYTVVIDSERAL